MKHRTHSFLSALRRAAYIYFIIVLALCVNAQSLNRQGNGCCSIDAAHLPSLRNFKVKSMAKKTHTANEKPHIIIAPYLVLRCSYFSILPGFGSREATPDGGIGKVRDGNKVLLVLQVTTIQHFRRQKMYYTFLPP